MRTTALLLALLAAACGGAPESQSFQFPAGDVVAGRKAFAEIKCTFCHAVVGEDFPAPRIDPPVPVKLGEQWAAAPSREDLATAIMEPSCKITEGYRREMVTNAGIDSRMWDFTQLMTVRQLIDIVEFLRAVPKQVPATQ